MPIKKQQFANIEKLGLEINFKLYYNIGGKGK